MRDMALKFFNDSRVEQPIENIPAADKLEEDSLKVLQKWKYECHSEVKVSKFMKFFYI